MEVKQRLLKLAIDAERIKKASVFTKAEIAEEIFSEVLSILTTLHVEVERLKGVTNV